MTSVAGWLTRRATARNDDGMAESRARSLRVAVGSMLLGLGGCTAAGSGTSGAEKPEATDDSRVGEKTTASTCEPPDCHINPGPNDVPPPKPEPVPQPEPLPQPEREPEPLPKPDENVNPGPQRAPEPKRVNTGPQRVP